MWSLTGDRSLAGAFNSNVIRRAMLFAAGEFVEKSERPLPIGKKGRDTLKKRGWTFVAEYLNVSSKWNFAIAKEIAGKIAELYAKREVDAVYAVYNEFKNVMVQNLRVGEAAADRSRGADLGEAENARTGTGARRSAAARFGGQRKIARRLHL